MIMVWYDTYQEGSDEEEQEQEQEQEETEPSAARKPLKSEEGEEDEKDDEWVSWEGKKCKHRRHIIPTSSRYSAVVTSSCSIVYFEVLVVDSRVWFDFLRATSVFSLFFSTPENLGGGFAFLWILRTR